MFGQHLTTSMSSYTTAQANTIVKDFIWNDGGYLSDVYTNILKKYYTSSVAEKLFVYTGLLIKSDLTSKLREVRNGTDDDIRYELNRHYRNIQTMRFITVAPELKGVGISRYNAAAETLISVVQNLWGSEHMELQRFYAHDSSLNNYEVMAGFTKCLYSPQWLADAPNAEHLLAVYKYATADTLQALFHIPSHGGYDGAETLGNLYQNLHSKETEGIMQPTVNEEQPG